MKLVMVMALVMLGALAALVQAEEPGWPQWRGLGRDSIVKGNDWPENLSDETLKLRWRVGLEGPSFSGPIIAGKLVYTTQTVDKKTEHVLALERGSGRKKWEVSWPGSMQVAAIGASGGSWIRATPATDGKTVFVLGMRDVLVALDAATGAERWRVDFPAQFKTPVPDFGGVASPLVHDGHVYVQGGSGLAKVHAKSGEVVWRVLTEGPGKSKNGAFSSPLLARIGGTEQLLLQTREEMAAVAPGDGKVLWRTKTPSMFGTNVLTPALYQERVFGSNIFGSYLIAGAEVKAAEPAEVRKPGDVLWRQSSAGYLSSPVVRDGHAYLHLYNQRFACLDLATGKQTWHTKPLGVYWSMVMQGDKVLALSERGVLRMFVVSPTGCDARGEVTLQDENGKARSTWAHLAVVGRELYIRDLTGLSMYVWGE